MSRKSLPIVLALLSVCFLPACGSIGPLDPHNTAMNQTAPEKYQVLFTTSKGDFTVEVTRALAPKGADRFYSLVKNDFFDDLRFFGSSAASWCSLESMAIRKFPQNGRTQLFRTTPLKNTTPAV